MNKKVHKKYKYARNVISKTSEYKCILRCSLNTPRRTNLKVEKSSGARTETA